MSKTTHQERIISPKNIRILISQQTLVLLKHMPEYGVDDLIEWYLKKRGIVLGSGDVQDFLMWLETKDQKSS